MLLTHTRKKSCLARQRQAFQLTSVLFLSNLTQISFLYKEDRTGCFAALKVLGKTRNSPLCCGGQRDKA